MLAETQMETTKMTWVANLKIQHCVLAMLVPQMYICFPHVKGVTLKGSLLQASITQDIQYKHYNNNNKL